MNNIVGCKCEITTDKARTGVVDINYSHDYVSGAINIVPNGLLDSREIAEHLNPVAGEWCGLPTLFHDRRGDLGFDLFAAAFFCISRIEEYGSTALDKHGRYEPSASIAMRDGLLLRPIVDEWCAELRRLLISKIPSLQVMSQPAKQLLTIDVDHVFKYRGKGLLRPLLGAARDLAKGDVAQLRERLGVLSGMTCDPFYCFDYIVSQMSQIADSAMFFIHEGGRGKYDKKTIGRNRRFDELVTRLARDYKVGIHPSYKSSFSPEGIMREAARLKALTGQMPRQCRMHFLRIRIPETYRMLDRLGFTDDYSLAYSAQAGFRAGTAVPFRFFDVAADKELNITLHTTCAMDVTLKNSLRLDVRGAANLLMWLREKVAATGGEYITLFHNSSLGEDVEWKGWREVFESVVSEIGKQ